MNRLALIALILFATFADEAFAQTRSRQRTRSYQNITRSVSPKDQIASAPVSAPAPAPIPQPPLQASQPHPTQDTTALYQQIAREEAEAAAERQRALAAAEEAKAERERQRLKDQDALKKKAKTAISSADGECQNILSDLNEILSLAGITMVASAIGTVTGAAALVAGIAKAMTDKEIENIENKLKGYADLSEEELTSLVESWSFEEKIAEVKSNLEYLRILEQKTSRSTVLGHVRTAGLIATTATSVTSAITSGAGASRLGQTAGKMKKCNAEVSKIKAIDAEMEQGGISSDDPVRVGISFIAKNCPGFDPSVIETIQKQLSATSIVSAVGAGVAAVGTTTSIIANSKSIRETEGDDARKKEKALNLASNIAAGVSTATSAFSAIFSDITGKSVTTQAQIAAKCEAAF